MKKHLKFFIAPLSVLVFMSFLWAPQNTMPNDTILVQEEHNDSIMLAKLWKRTALYIIGVDSLDGNTWSYEQIDSVLTFEYVNAVHIDEGRVHYSPDDKLKVYTFYAETCAAYCFSWEESYLSYGDMLQYMEINRVDSIHVLDDEKHLILDHTVEKRGPEYVIVYNAKVISLQADSVMVTPIESADGNAFEVTMHSNYKGEVFEYDEEKKILKFIYPSAYILDEESGEDNVDVYTMGVYGYIDRKFSLAAKYVSESFEYKILKEAFNGDLGKYFSIKDYCKRISFLEEYYYDVKAQKSTDIIYIMANEIAEKSSIECTYGGNYIGPEYTDEEFEKDIKAWRAYFNCNEP